MKSLSRNTAALTIAFLGLALANALDPINGPVFAQQTSAGNDKSWTDSISSGIKRSVDKVGQLGKPNPPKTSYSSKDDPISLSNKTKPGPELYVAVARLFEEAGKTDDAAQQYQAALRLKPNYLPALLGYAGLQDRLGNTEEALRLYQRAIATHPKEAAPAYNNMGLCLARRKRPGEAIAAMTEAVKLAPKNPLYRNNAAVLLVEQGRFREAFGHLRAVHEEAAAYYNMGYLLYQKGKTQAAAQHFVQALRADPSMTPARQWLDYLQKETAQARRTQPVQHADSPPPVENVAAPPGRTAATERGSPRASREPPPMPSDPPPPRRLPPTGAGGAELDDAPLPGIQYRRPALPEAPMPPPSRNPAIQPLPPVG